MSATGEGHLLERLIAGSGDVHFWSGRGYAGRPWRELVDDAWRRAAALARLGVGPGDRVGIVLTNSPDAVTTTIGAWLRGAVVASLPLPARGQTRDAHRAMLRAIAIRVELRTLLVDGGSTDAVEGLGVTVAGFDSLVGGVAPPRPDPCAPDRIAFVQFSSGATGVPKGCVLSWRAVDAQVRALQSALEFDPARDSLLSWLPLSHDMGFFGGVLTPRALGCPVFVGTPERFLTAPGSWLGDCADTGATVTVGPDFALAVAARAAARRRPARRLAL
ncbi:MAG TPA: AMP-binding protein, partial [Thermoleophilaceae bacterium]|nr:AMP-binding protein [Thermoleophilaceae bacterium]